MKEEAVEEIHRGEVVDVLIDGKNGGHVYEAALHDEVRHGKPKDRPQEILRPLVDVHQVTRYEQKAGHVEGEHHLLDVGVQLLEPHQMETDDKQYENALQKVEFLDARHGMLWFLNAKLQLNS